MRGGKGGTGRSGGKPNRGGKSITKPGTKPGAAPAARFAGKPKRGEAKSSFGGRPSDSDAPKPSRSGPTRSRPSVAPARPPRSGGDAPAATHTTTPAGGGALTVQRTLNVPASAVIRCINDVDRREWAPERLYRVVSVLAPRFIRLAFPDGSFAAIAVNRQGNARCTVSVELSRLPEHANDRALRERWSHALAALEDQVDASWD